MAGEKSKPGESSRPDGLSPGGTVNTDAAATDSAGPALAIPPLPLSAPCCCCCCGATGAREPMRSCVKLVGPAPVEAEAPASASEGKSAEASVSGPGLASPVPVKRDSEFERGGSARRGRGGGRADMVAGVREREEEDCPLLPLL
jgi:hypothetical protein